MPYSIMNSSASSIIKLSDLRFQRALDTNQRRAFIGQLQQTLRIDCLIAHVDDRQNRLARQETEAPYLFCFCCGQGQGAQGPVLFQMRLQLQEKRLFVYHGLIRFCAFGAQLTLDAFQARLNA